MKKAENESFLTSWPFVLFLKLIEELRSGKPEPCNTFRFLKILGFALLMPGSFLCTVTFSSIFNDIYRPISYYYFTISFAITFTGALMIISAYGIRSKKEWSKRLGQIISCMVTSMVLFSITYPVVRHWNLTNISSIIGFLLIFGLPYLLIISIGFFAVRYFSRLNFSNQEFLNHHKKSESH